MTRKWIADVQPRAMGPVDCKIPAAARGGSGLGGGVRIGIDPSSVFDYGLCGLAFGASGRLRLHGAFLFLGTEGGGICERAASSPSAFYHSSCSEDGSQY